MYFGDRKKNRGGRAEASLKKWWDIREKIMAGYLWGNYGGRFAGILCLGRLEVNHSTADNDAE
jgi:hypothetical protein